MKSIESMRITALILAFFVPLHCIPVSAQDNKLPAADQVIDQFLDALGSQTHTTTTISGEFSGPLDGEIQVLYKNSKIRFDMNFESFGIISQGFDGSEWWKTEPGSNERRSLRDNELANAKKLILLTQQFFTWRDFDGEIDVVAETTFSAKPAYHLRFSYRNGGTVDRYFDKSSRMLLGSNSEINGIENTMSFDFQEIDGIKCISKITNEQGRIAPDAEDAVRYEIKFTKFEFNKEIEDSKFAGPPGD